MNDLLITSLLIVSLFALLGSGVWIGLTLAGVAWIGMEQVYGALAQNAGFVAHFAEALAFIWAHGVDAALKRYIEKKREFRPR